MGKSLRTIAWRGGIGLGLLLLVLTRFAQAAGPTSTTIVTATLDADGVQRATLILDSYSFDPSHLMAQVNKPVELTLKNVSTLAPHNFKLDSATAGLYVSGNTKAGQTAIVRFTPTKPGVFEFYCDKKLAFLPSHRDKGMVGKLEVR